jgi:hypothetical protein
VAARLVPERVRFVIEKREPFALTNSLAIDAARRNPREAVLAWFSAPFALDASASSAEPHAPAPDDDRALGSRTESRSLAPHDAAVCV